MMSKDFQKAVVGYIAIGLAGVLIGVLLIFFPTYAMISSLIPIALTITLYFDLRFVPVIILASLIAVQFTNPELLWTEASKLSYTGSIATITIPGIVANFTLLEFLLLPTALLVIFSHVFTKAKIKTTAQRYIRWIFILWTVLLLLILLGFLHAANSVNIIKEFFKWFEIGLLTTATFMYVKNKPKFIVTYWFLFFVYIFNYLGKLLENIMIAQQPLDRVYASPELNIALLLPFIDKRLVAIVLLAFFPFLVLTYSRIVWFNTILLFIASLFLFRKSVKGQSSRIVVYALIILMIATAIVVSIGPIKEILVFRIQYAMSGADQSLNDRIAFYKAGWLAFVMHPLTGIGAGNFKDYLSRVYTLAGFRLSYEVLPKNPHSQLLEFLSELGIPGLITSVALVFLLWKVLRMGRRQIDLLGDENLRRYALGLHLHFIPLISLLFVDFIGMESRLMWGIYFGLILSSVRIVKKQLNNLIT